jgi:hypothetical protein
MKSNGASRGLSYDWFTEVDEVFRLATAIEETDETFREDRMKQRYALTTLYFATGGPKWNNQVLWLNASAHECSWYGCYCTEGLNGSLLGLDLSEHGVQGNVPPEVGMLGTSLEHVGFIGNSLIGNLPTELGQLKGLKELNIASNMLTQVLPTELGDLIAMEHLEIEENAFNGALPEQIGQMSRLTTLQMNDNFWSSRSRLRSARSSTLLTFPRHETPFLERYRRV